MSILGHVNISYSHIQGFHTCWTLFQSIFLYSLTSLQIVHCRLLFLILFSLLWSSVWFRSGDLATFTSATQCHKAWMFFPLPRIMLLLTRFLKVFYTYAKPSHTTGKNNMGRSKIQSFILVVYCGLVNMWPYRAVAKVSNFVLQAKPSLLFQYNLRYLI